MHYRSPPTTQCRSALGHAHPASVKTNPQTVRTVATAPIWLWLPLGQGEQPKVDPMVWEVDESPTSVSEASVTPKCVCDWSVEAMATLRSRCTMGGRPYGLGGGREHHLYV